jgi:hypothetical protein
VRIPARPHPAPRTTAPSASTAMADHVETPSKKDTRVPSPLQPQSLSSSVSSLGRSPPPSAKMSTSPSPHSAHRSSFAEHMRGGPSSPRASRQPSLSQQAFHDLINNPPTKPGDPRFHGRDWKTIRLGEIVDTSQVRFVEYDTSVEDATSVSHMHPRAELEKLMPTVACPTRLAQCCSAA